MNELKYSRTELIIANKNLNLVIKMGRGILLLLPLKATTVNSAMTNGSSTDRLGWGIKSE